MKPKNKTATRRKPKGKAVRYLRSIPADAERAGRFIEVAPHWRYWELDASLRCTLMTGVDPQQYRGKTLWEYGRDASAASDAWDMLASLLRDRKPFTDFLYTHTNSAGELRFISVSGQPRLDAKGRFQGYRGTSQDVTRRTWRERLALIDQKIERVHAESSDLNNAAPRLLRALCEILDFAGGGYWEHTSHEAMLGKVSWAADNAPDVARFLAARQLAVPAADGLIADVVTGGEPRWIADFEKHGSAEAAEALAAGVRSALAFPIILDARVIGVMEFYSRTSYQPDMELLEAASYIGIGIGEFCQRRQVELDMVRFRASVDMSGDAIYLVDRTAMRFVDANQTACRFANRTREEMLAIGPHDLLLADRKELEVLYDAVIAKGEAGVRSEMIARAKDGRLRTVELHRRALREGGRWLIVTVSRDVTRRKRAEIASHRLGRMYAALGATNEAILRAKSAEQLYQRVCEAAVDGGEFLMTAVILPDNDRASTRIVAAAGKGAEGLQQARISIDTHNAEGNGLVGTAFRTQAACISNDFLDDARTRPWHNAARGASIASGAAVPLQRGERTVGVLLFYSIEKDAFDAEIVKLLERMAENIAFALESFDLEAERKRAEARIEYLATHDALTALPNRVLFNQVLTVAIESARRYQRQFAVLFIDLDRFKVINDTLGHEAGDMLLKEMSERFKHCLRASDVVARLGGDEFVVLVQEVNEVQQVTTVARKILSAALKPSLIFGQECRVTASVGIALYPTDAEDASSLMKNADIAMYLAKEEGKNNFQFYSKEIKAQSLERMTLETNLRRALERDELSLHYQAKLDLRTGQITGVEALLRWQSPELGAVSPMQLIPVAEETGLIVPIGRWVLRTACAQNVAWQRDGMPPICMAVNLSPRQFADPDLVSDIVTTLSETGMAPELLELEITESMVMHNVDRAVRLLTEIKQLGVRLAIDDFGTGYSSLAQLKRFPIDTLKVDRSFIREIPNDSEDRAITEAIIAMGKSLSLNIVAEGVETEQQQTFLREHACDEMQGFYFSKPIAPEQFAELVRGHVAKAM